MMLYEFKHENGHIQTSENASARTLELRYECGYKHFRSVGMEAWAELFPRGIEAARILREGR
jgi:hypothetical protein